MLSKFKLNAVLVAILFATGGLAFYYGTTRSTVAGDPVISRMKMLIADRKSVAEELSREPYAEAGKSPLEAYLMRIRRDGVPQHSEMRRKLAQIAEDNAAILALAEVYEPQAKSPDYANRLRALRTHVITWNERWYGVFETFMAGGNLAGGEPPFPEDLLATSESK